MEKNKLESPGKSLIVLFSYHHNTEKIAKAMAKVLNAEIKMLDQINPEELPNYDLIGFGSGIYNAKHHKDLLDLADKLPLVISKKAFLFSTGALTGKAKAAKDHSKLRKKLQSKGYTILTNFNVNVLTQIASLSYLGNE